MASKHAVIEQETGTVLNVVAWSGDAKVWQPEQGLTMVPIEEGQRAEIGGRYDAEARHFEPAPRSADVGPRPLAELVTDLLVDKGLITAADREVVLEAARPRSESPPKEV